MKTDDINIVKYNPDWVRLAEEEIAILDSLFSNENWVVDIQHIGSTAVPGLSAKPIIDIYVGVNSIEVAQTMIPLIEELGYQFWSENPNKEKMFFVKGMPPFGEGRTHHIHVVKYEGDLWRARILFRDYMRSHTEEIRAYSQLKQDFQKLYSQDREAYTDAKLDYIASVLKKAGFKDVVRR